MSSNIDFTPKRFSKRLSRSSNFSPIGEITSQFSSQAGLNDRSPSLRIYDIGDEAAQAPASNEFEDTFCLYCQELDLNCLAKCEICSNSFCNSGIKDSSHIYLHSKFSTHTSFKLLNYEKNGCLNPPTTVSNTNSGDITATMSDSDNKENENISPAEEAPIIKPKKYNDLLIECADCGCTDIGNLSFVLINNVTKELVNLKTEYFQVDQLANTDKKLIFFCSRDVHVGTGIGGNGNDIGSKCFNSLQDKLFGGLEIEEDFVKPIMNCYDSANKFGFKKFFANRLILKDNSINNTKLIYNQLSLSHIYTIETNRIKELKKRKLKQNDVYNFIDESNDYQFFDSDDDNDENDDEIDNETSGNDILRETSAIELESRFTSPLLMEENETIQNKTTALKKIAKSHLSKASVYQDFKAFAFHNLNLMYKEQFAMLSLSSTTHKLSNNMVFVPYKKAAFKTETDFLSLTMRLNTNHNLPVLKINQVLGIKHVETGRIAFGMIKEVPNNSFNPEIKLKMLKYTNFRDNSFNPSDLFIDNLETTLASQTNKQGSSLFSSFKNAFDKTREEANNSAASNTFHVDAYISDHTVFNVLPFDLVFSRIIDIIFQILTSKIELNEFLMSVILGKNFENFEFNLSSFKSNNFYHSNFNLSQKRAIDNLDSNKVVMIKGQVGTGKTLVSSTVIKNLIVKDLKPVLVCSGANSTVDNLCERFYRDYVVKKIKNGNGIDDNNDDDEVLISRLISPLKENQYSINHKIGHLCFHNFILANAPEELINLFIKEKINSNSISPKNAERLNKFYTDFFQQQDVIFTTCYNACDPKLKDVKFKSIIIDDCSTTMNLLTLIPLSKNCGKLVLIGDDKQLNPYIHDMKMKGPEGSKLSSALSALSKNSTKDVEDASSQDIGCNFLKQSLFQRILYNQLVKPIVLTVQYRMGAKLAEFPNHFFYNNELTNGVVKQRMSITGGGSSRNSLNGTIGSFPWPNQRMPIVFWDQANNVAYQENEIRYRKKINSIENFAINQKTYQNCFDAQKVIEMIKHLHFGCGVSLKDIGVITPFVGQRVMIAQMIIEEFANYQDGGNKRNSAAGNGNKRNSRRTSMHKRSSSMSGNMSSTNSGNQRQSFHGNGSANGHRRSYSNVGANSAYGNSNNYNGHNASSNHNNHSASFGNYGHKYTSSNKSYTGQFQKLSSSTADILFENHDPNEYELSVIDKAKGVEVGSIDSFQGKEKEYVIFSTVKSEGVAPDNLEEMKILNDYRRLNVGITRARRGLVLIGSSARLAATSKHWANYLAYLYEQDGVVEGEEVMVWKGAYKEHLTYLRR